MKKLFSGLVLVALLFSACNKESAPAAAGDDVFDANLKGYASLVRDGIVDLYDVQFTDLAFTWNAITASDFAHGKTPPFNNWEKPIGDGVYVYRVPAKEADKGFKSICMSEAGAGLQALYDKKKQNFGNGNDPVWIWFDKAEIDALELVSTEDCAPSLTVLVRYRSSNNVAFKFNILEAAEWCATEGPISLDFQWTVYSGVYGVVPVVDLGEITQVRIEDPDYCGGKEKWELCAEYSDWDPFCVEYEDCTTIPVTDFKGLIKAIEDELADNQEIGGWVFTDTGETFEFDVTEVCYARSIEPVIITWRCVTVVINGVETKECFSGDDDCSEAYVDLGAFSTEDCIIVGWNGNIAADFVLNTCIEEDLVFVADLKCLGGNLDSVTATTGEGGDNKDPGTHTLVGHNNHFCVAVLTREQLVEGVTVDMVVGANFDVVGTAFLKSVNGTIEVTVDGVGKWAAAASSKNDISHSDQKHNNVSPADPGSDIVYLYIHFNGRLYQ